MVTIYTTHCPKCRVIETKLKTKGIQYKEVTDVAEIEKLGFQQVPVLDVDGTIMDFVQANNWINNYTGGQV